MFLLKIYFYRWMFYFYNKRFQWRQFWMLFLYHFHSFIKDCFLVSFKSSLLMKSILKNTWSSGLCKSLSLSLSFFWRCRQVSELILWHYMNSWLQRHTAAQLNGSVPVIHYYRFPYVNVDKTEIVISKVYMHYITSFSFAKYLPCSL